MAVCPPPLAPPEDEDDEDPEADLVRVVAEPDFDELDGAVREDEDEPLEPDVELPARELPELEDPDVDEPEPDEPLELDPELGRETACCRSGIDAVGASRVRLASPPPPDPPD